MGIVNSFKGAISGTFADQWRDIITAGSFDEHTAVFPGALQQPSKGRGSYNDATNGVISNGSKIYVPENTAAFIFNQSGIEEIITEAGGYEYWNGQESILSEGTVTKSLFGQTIERFRFGGQSSDNKRVAFVNLREIRGIKFGTRGPLVYNDLFYGTDLEVLAYGTFSVKIVDPISFVRNFVPANVDYYTFDDNKARSQIISEFLQSFTQTLNALSSKYRISQLPSQTKEIAETISNTSSFAGTWTDRFGFDIVGVGIENIVLSETSKELVNQYSSAKMQWKASENVSQETSNIVAQQKIAQGIQEHGLGNGVPGMVLGMNVAQAMTPQNSMSVSPKAQMSFDEQIEAVKKLKELLDGGVLSQDEFNIKKKEIMGL
jgi:membrane protease subunit (stomatin/prohibitin family)